MAERRMFAKTIIDSDAFLDMGLSAQALYFHLCMRADDEGFINNPRKIQRMIGAGDDDLRLLAAKRFIIPFDSGVVVIKHWRIHNYIRGDRFKPTVYVEEREKLDMKENGAYTCLPSDNQMDTKCVPDDNQLTTNCVPNDYQMDTQVRLGKDRVGKDRAGKDTICAEPLLAASVPQMILNDGSAFYVTADDLKRWKELYPAVDVEQELRNMAGWLDANPTRRKTRSGIRRFITGWLAKEQNRERPGGRNGIQGTSTPDRIKRMLERGDFDEP